jgi:hypothetical protein
MQMVRQPAGAIRRRATTGRGVPAEAQRRGGGFPPEVEKQVPSPPRAVRRAGQKVAEGRMRGQTDQPCDYPPTSRSTKKMSHPKNLWVSIADTRAIGLDFLAVLLRFESPRK